MKRFLAFFIIASIAGGGYSYGQSGESSKLSYGVKAGLNLASYHLTSEYKADLKEANGRLMPLISFHIGGYADYAVSESFSVQGGLTLSGKGYKERYSYDEDYMIGPAISGTGTVTEHLIYLEIPVNAIYKTGRFYVGGGPYIGAALSGKWTEKGEEEYDDGDTESTSDSGKIEFGKDGYYKRTDFGINFLAGYQLKNNINVGIGYGIGLNSLYSTDNSYWSPKNRVFSISVGYTFGK